MIPAMLRLLEACRRLLPLATVCAVTGAIAQPYEEDGEHYSDDHAVILVYHHVAADTPASTSVTPEAFAAQLAWLRDNDFAVLPLDEVLWRLTKGKRFPPNSVAFTFDDAYVSVYDTAWPMLREYDWPFAVFVSTDYVDRGYGGYMNWEQLRHLSAAGVLIGNHGVRHASALARAAGDSRGKWLEAVEQDALQARERIRKETGVAPGVYAWPYGEFNDAVEQIIADQGWYGLGQQSGPAGYDSSLTALPRFPVSSGFANLDTFAERVNTEPLPVRVRNAPDRLRAVTEPPALTLFMNDKRFELERVACFDSGGAKLQVARRGRHSIEVRAAVPLPAGRSKYTCTAPHRHKPGVYGWYSHPWVVGGRDGS